MIQLEENKNVAIKTIVTVTLLVWSLVLIFTGLSLNELRPAFGYLFSVTMLVGLVSYCVRTWLWRLPPLSWFFQIPDISGRWEGWYQPDLTKEWRPTAHEISQYSLDISAVAFGPKNCSQGICSSIVVDRHGVFHKLVWTYKTGPMPASQGSSEVGPGDSHTGTHFMHFSSKDNSKRLRGEYFNNRKRKDGTLGAVGFIELTWVSRKCVGDLAYDEQNWGMGKPSNEKTDPLEAKS